MELFKEQVSDKSREIDPGHEQDWYSLTLGWALASGLDPEEAHQFASNVRYKTNLA